MKPFRWSTRKEEAAQLVAADELTNGAIAERLGVSRQACDLWKRHPEFRARVAAHVEAARAAILRRGVAIRENRVQALQDRWVGLRRVIAERAEDPVMAAVPGGQTGLLAHTVKGVGAGDHFQLVDHWELDVALLKELREHEKQAAQEVAQWTERYELSHLTDEQLIEQISGFPNGVGKPPADADRRRAYDRDRTAPADSEDVR